jgi:hypothetical protein
MNKLISALKKVVNEKPKVVKAVPLNPQDLKKSLDILKQEQNFEKLKKDFYSLRDALSEKASLSQEQATSLINYALHSL